MEMKMKMRIDHCILCLTPDPVPLCKSKLYHIIASYRPVSHRIIVPFFSRLLLRFLRLLFLIC